MHLLYGISKAFASPAKKKNQICFHGMYWIVFPIAFADPARARQLPDLCFVMRLCRCSEGNHQILAFMNSFLYDIWHCVLFISRRKKKLQEQPLPPGPPSLLCLHPSALCLCLLPHILLQTLLAECAVGVPSANTIHLAVSHCDSNACLTRKLQISSRQICQEMV